MNSSQFINNEDITVVVQGPVQTLSDRPQEEGITLKCLNSVRQYLPGSKIILSTWNNQDLSNLDYDQLVINDDPGPNILNYSKKNKPHNENTNRLIVSTLGGLKEVKTKYAIKLRSDNYLTGDGFKKLFLNYQERGENFKLFKQRVVVINTYFREYTRGMRSAFVVCDFFNFGLLEDVIKLWDRPLLSDFEFDPAKKGLVQSASAPLFRLDVTQELFLTPINQMLDKKIDLQHLLDVKDNKLQICEEIYANNLVTATPKKVGVGLTVKFMGKARVSKFKSRVSFYSHKKWQLLYQRYCDKSFVVPNATRYKINRWILQLLFVRNRAIGSKFRMLRNRLVYFIKAK